MPVFESEHGTKGEKDEEHEESFFSEQLEKIQEWAKNL